MTLEDYFYTFEDKLDNFPGKHNYVSAYKTFKDFMDKEVHKETKAMTLVKDEGDIYLNDHSSDHIQMVIEKVSKILWIEGIATELLNPLECFILLSAIQIHDARHIIGGRENHEQNAKEFLKNYDGCIVGSPEKKIIYEIARAHSGKDDPIFTKVSPFRHFAKRYVPGETPPQKIQRLPSRKPRNGSLH